MKKITYIKPQLDINVVQPEEMITMSVTLPDASKDDVEAGTRQEDWDDDEW